MPEQQIIEYKQRRYDDYLKWVCDFGNAVGGVIFHWRLDVETGHAPSVR